jgi:hypothetical protein
MLLPFFKACEASWIGNHIRASQWLFPAIEAVHLIALAVIGGAVLLVDLRLLGFGLRDQPVARVARSAQPWLIGSLLVMIATGLLMFLSESVKCYYSDAFWWKMAFLASSIVFAFTVRRWVTLAEEARIAPLWSKAVALTSLMLWFGVGAGGRWIGFS